MDDLANKSREELVEIAKNLNIKVHHKAKEDTIIKQIMQQNGSRVEDAKKPKPKKGETVFHSEDEVREVLKPYIAKEGYNVIFNHVDNTVHLSYKGSEECLNLSVPMRLIERRAAHVARGRISPRGLGRDGTYGQSYADTILAC